MTAKRVVDVRAEWVLDSEPGWWIGRLHVAHMNATECGTVEVVEQEHWPAEFRAALLGLVAKAEIVHTKDEVGCTCEDNVRCRIREALDHIDAARPPGGAR